MSFNKWQEKTKKAETVFRMRISKETWQFRAAQEPGPDPGLEGNMFDGTVLGQLTDWSAGCRLGKIILLK